MASLIARFLEFAERDRVWLLVLSGSFTALIALLDANILASISLGYLYFIPIFAAAGFLWRWQVVAYAALCAVLREKIGPFADDEFSLARQFLSFAAFASSGLLAKQMVMNRRADLEHARELEKQIHLRQDAEEQLRILIESTPAAILTADSEGSIVLANEGAGRLLGCDWSSLPGRPISDFIPDLARVPLSRPRGFLRTSMECTGRRNDGSPFLAEVWLSTYTTRSGPTLAAIIVDLSEQLRSREGNQLDSLMSTSRLLVAAVLHEVRNLCAAASVAHANLARDNKIAVNEDFKVLGTLVAALEQVASSELKVVSDREEANTDLRAVLDELRIVVEPLVAEELGETEFPVLDESLRVRADPHSLMQVLLNLARNSIRAMGANSQRKIRLEVEPHADHIKIRFRDSGPGVADPTKLFHPFQAESETTGLGLYVSRAIVRSFGGELYHEPTARGCCFVVQLPRAPLPHTIRNGKQPG